MGKNSKTKQLVKLEIVISDNGVRFYGNRDFFRHLKSEMDHLINCVEDGYCEFQTISLAADRPSGLTQKPFYRVFKEEVDLDGVVTKKELDNNDFDAIFMTIEDKGFST